MPRDLRALPWTKVVIKLAPQLRHLLTNALELRLPIGASGKMAQLLRILFEPVDLTLAPAVRRSFIFGGHHITKSMDWAPQICLTDSISSAFTATRCCACNIAT